MSDADEDRDSLSPHPFGMPDHRQVRPWLIAGGAALLVVVLAVAGFVLLHRPAHQTPGPAAPPGPVASQSASSAVATLTTASQAASSASIGSTATTPSPGASSTQPAAPAPSGARLETLAAQPQNTIALIVVPRGFAGADFSVVLVPYGLGASGAAGGVLVAKVVSSKPGGPAARSLKQDFVGQNVALYCTPAILSTVSSGGRWQGTIHVRPQGDVGVLLLTQVARAK